MGTIISAILGSLFGLWVSYKWSKSSIKIGKGNMIQNVGDRCTSISGSNININNGEIIVDGEVIESGLKNYNFTVNVEGGCESVTTSQGDINVYGDVHKNVQTSQGDIEVKNSVGGSVTTSQGDVECGSVGGNVKTTMGDISYRK